MDNEQCQTHVQEKIRASTLENSNAILFYHSKTPFYQYTIPFYNISTSQNSIFIKILFFLPFFIILFPTVFLGFPTAIFIPLSQPLAPVQHTTHTHTHDTPIILPKPITTPTHTNTNTNIKPATKSHTQTQTSNKATHTNTNHQQSHTYKPSNQSTDQQT